MHMNDRYSRQILLRSIQEEGQEILSRSNVVVVGCGALGTTIANNLVRSGIGSLTVVDRDIVELNNLQRQNLFNENDIGFPKASIIAKKLERINSTVKINYFVDDLNYENIERIFRNSDVVLDGTDNMFTRFLINDSCVKHNIPWIYGGAIETHGMTMNIIPNKSQCFRCILPDLPDPGSLPTCDTVGVLSSIPNIIGSIQSTEAIKILLNKKISRDLLVYNVWNHDFQKIRIKKKKNCICCSKHDFEFLNAKKKEEMISLCGQGAIQITPAKSMNVSFEDLAKKLQKSGEIEIREIVMRFKIPDYEFNIFSSGRTIIMGTNDKKVAKSLYAKYIGF